MRGARVRDKVEVPGAYQRTGRCKAKMATDMVVSMYTNSHVELVSEDGSANPSQSPCRSLFSGSLVFESNRVAIQHHNILCITTQQPPKESKGSR
jgi:hypothetical protein